MYIERFPGEAVSEDGFWQTLVDKHCASSKFPADRINIDAFYDADFAKQNKVGILYFETIHGTDAGQISTKNAHFLAEDVRNFDAQFFSILPQEAGAMDPQHGGLMETVYHAIENGMIRTISWHTCLISDSWSINGLDCWFRYLDARWLLHYRFFDNKLEGLTASSKIQCYWDCCLNSIQ